MISLCLLLGITLILVVIHFFILFRSRPNYWEARGFPFYIPSSYFQTIKSLILKEESMHDKIHFIYKKFRNHPYVGIMLLNKPILIVKSPELIKTILVENFDKFINRNSSIDDSVCSLTAHSLFFAQDKVWKSLRRKITPAFSSGKMKLMFPLKNECVRNLVKFVETSDGMEIELQDVTARFLVDIVSSCAFGIEANALSVQNRKSEVFEMSKKLVDLKSFKRNLAVFGFFLFPALIKVMKVSFCDPDAMDYFSKMFMSSYGRRTQLNIQRHDLIDLLHNLVKSENLVGDYKFDEVSLVAQALSFYLAGTDTTASAMTFLLYELALNSEIQDRLRHEVCEIYEKYDRQFPYESLQEMTYLDKVINETLRKYPAGAFILRESAAKYTFPDSGLTIDEKTTVLLAHSAILYDPEYFPNPENFDPERFSQENIQKIKPFSYIPFGEGPKICIGKRLATIVLKLSVASLIQRFQFEKCEKTKIPLQMESTSLILHSRDGVWLKVKKFAKKLP